MRSSEIAAVVAAAGVVLVASISCKHDKETACNIDTDCPQGSFCRSNVCANVAGEDGGVDGSPPATSCVAAGGACASDDDCCVRPCTAQRCVGSSGSSGRTSSGASGTSGTSGSSGTNCSDIYGSCSVDTDCCTGLSCLDSVCR